jgi:Ca2+-binding RTX toxin-like protein
VFVDGGAGNDTFVGSALGEVFLGGDGDDTATLGDGDFFDMGAGFDKLLVRGTDSRDEIHFDALRHQGHEEAHRFGKAGDERAVFDNGEAVTIFTEGGDDRVTVHRKAAALWDVNIVQ